MQWIKRRCQLEMYIVHTLYKGEIEMQQVQLEWNAEHHGEWPHFEWESERAGESEIKWIKLGETIINFKSSWRRHGIEFPICPISKNTFSKPNKSILYLILATHNTNNSSSKKAIHLCSFSRFLNANKTMSGAFVRHRQKLSGRHQHGKMNRSNQSQERS